MHCTTDSHLFSRYAEQWQHTAWTAPNSVTTKALLRTLQIANAEQPGQQQKEVTPDTCL